jgi:glycosyltransferase involved in cell wall biosynthesis
VLVSNLPLDAHKGLWQASRRSGAAYLFWMQDILSRATSHYLGRQFGLAGKLVAARYSRLERAILRGSDAVIAISDLYCPVLAGFGVEPQRISVIPNWAPLAEITVLPKDNEWARSHQLTDKSVALYTGTLKLMENPKLLLDLATAGQATGLEVVVVAQGAGAAMLALRKQEQGLRNLTILPLQPIEQYPMVLASGDILVAALDPAASEFSVPSKILTYLAAGRPIVASIPAHNDAATTIRESGAGFVSDPQNAGGFIEDVFRLARDRDLRLAMGANGRKFAEAHFAIEERAGRFERLISDTLRGQSRLCVNPAGRNIECDG